MTSALREKTIPLLPCVCAHTCIHPVYTTRMPRPETGPLISEPTPLCAGLCFQRDPGLSAASPEGSSPRQELESLISQDLRRDRPCVFSQRIALSCEQPRSCSEVWLVLFMPSVSICTLLSFAPCTDVCGAPAGVGHCFE